MKITKSYTGLISGTQSKTAILENTLSEITKLSEFAFNNKNLWKDYNGLYNLCRLQFPDLGSKILQNFLRFSYFKSGKKPKSPVKSSIYLDYQCFDFQINSNKLTNFWLKIRSGIGKNFPIFGKYLKTRILDPEKVKLIQIFKKRNKFYSKITYVLEIPDPPVRPEGPTIGLDMNFRTVVLSNNSFFRMAQLAHRKIEHKKNKKELKNFTKDYVHKLTTEMANYLESEGVSHLVLEDLKNMRKSASRKLGTSKGKLVNFIINSMPYSMVRSFLSYKCLEKGIEIVTINPAYTSKTCSRCGSLATERLRNSFVCSECGCNLHADLNAARNIMNRAISSDDGSLETMTLPAV